MSTGPMKKTENAAFPLHLTLQETAGILNTSMKTLRRRIDAGQLPVIRDGRIVRVHPRDLQWYISARRSL